MKTLSVTLKKAVIEMLMLNLLDKRDMYGYEITQGLKKQSDGRLTVKEGSMYPILYRLESENYITSYETVVGARMTRVYYHIEDSGRELLKSMKAEFDEYVALINAMYEMDAPAPSPRSVKIAENTGAKEDTASKSRVFHAPKNRPTLNPQIN